MDVRLMMFMAVWAGSMLCLELGVSASPIFVLRQFKQCVSDTTQCAQNLALGQYPLCSDCSKFVKCSGAVITSAIITCPTGLHYDVTQGVCDYRGRAVCGTTSTSQASKKTSSLIRAPSHSIKVSQVSPARTADDTHSVGRPTVTIHCVNAVSECQQRNLASGRYAVCSDCSKYIICDDTGGSLITCGARTQYDVNLRVCNFIGLATCA